LHKKAGEGMAKLNQLIKDLCPAGVPYLKISDIADTFIGLATSVTKYKSESGVQLLHNSDISEGKIIVKTVEYITEAFAQKNSKKLLRKNDVITVHTGNVGTSAVITEEYDGCIGFTTISSRVKNQNQISPEYLCAFLNSNASKEQIAGKSISDRNNLNLAAFDEIVIPVPPLPVQEEIVRILDSFTELTAELAAELTAELIARKQQYECYRDTLLTFENVPLENLGNVCAVERGTRVVRGELDENTGIPVYQNSLTPLGYHTEANRYANTPFVIGAGGAGQIGFSYENYWAADDCYTFSKSNRLNGRYLYFVLQMNGHKIARQVRKASIPRLPREALENLKIAVPPLDVQEQLVKLLDSFDTICTDLNSGLPAEIEARQKQYEYYRDKLLTFTPAE
jgi:type I restriction enzyme S subunit